MTDYNKQTVANLRKVLKERGIPSTGLTRKADIVAKLEEADQAGDASEPVAPAESPSKEPAEQQDEEKAADSEAGTLPTADTSLETQATDTTIAPDAPSEAEKEQAISTTSSTTLPAEIRTQSPAEETQPISEPAQEATAPSTTVFTSSDADMKLATPPAEPNEAQSVEKPEPIVEKPIESSVEPSRLNSEELEADRKKRKRRSDTPDLPVEKKLRQAGEAADVVHLREDGETTDTNMVDKPSVIDGAKQGDANGAGEVNIVQQASSAEERASSVKDTVESKTITPVTEDKTAIAEQKSKEKDTRYKDIFQAPETVSAPRPDTSSPDDRPIQPALHPATAAVYIRNFMRPLREPPLRAHLISLASPPSAKLDDSILKALFLDSMRTHALALFDSITAASRVRASLHGAKWPAERDRKELWVDFVPEDKVLGWIRQEEDSIAEERSHRERGIRGPPAKKWEVAYDEIDDGVVAVFQEVGAAPRRKDSIPAGPIGVPGAPSGPRSPTERYRRPSRSDLPPSRPSAEQKQAADRNFQTLDTLFKSTTAKPKLYYLPVESELAERRLDELDKETSRNWNPEDKVRGRGRNRVDQRVKFGFDGVRIVYDGPDLYGPYAAGAYRGGRGGGFGGRGGYRGGRGGGWR